MSERQNFNACAVDHSQGAGAAQDTISAVLRRLAAQPGERVSVGDLTDAFGDRALGAVVFVFALPLLLPLPPGASGLFALPLMFISAQWMMGRTTLWLPQRVRRRNCTRRVFQRLVKRVEHPLTKLEGRLRPRWGRLCGEACHRFLGAACFLLAIVVLLPIPFANMLPALAIAGLAIGAAEGDGVAAAVGWVAATLTALICTLLFKILLAAVTRWEVPGLLW